MRALTFVKENILVIWAWTAVALFAMAILGTHANALTLKKGEVLTSDGTVAHASSTATGQAALNRDGYLVSGGQVHIDAAGTVVSIDLAQLQGKSRTAIADIIGEELADELGSDLAEIEEAAVQAAYDAENGITELADKLGGEFADDFHDAYAAALEAAEKTGDWTEVDAINAQWDEVQGI